MPLFYKISVIGVLFIFCIYFFDSITFDSVPEVYNKKGSLIAKIGMTKNEIISNMGEAPYQDNSDFLGCFCYPVSFRDSIKTSYWRKNMFSNYLKIVFKDQRVVEIYFFGKNWFRGAICSCFPGLTVKINKNPYK